jgi:beta-phosphoglucomutase-like phosphatase (HAD superfamily)
MKYKAIIFDLDGTIVDTGAIWSQANKILIERRGVTYSPELKDELTRRIHGLATHRSVSIIKDMIKLEESIEELVKEKTHIAMSLYREGVEYIEGFKEFHNEIVGLNFAKAVATNADDYTIQTTHEALDLRTYFGEHIYGISAVGFICKPDPAIYLHAAEKLKVDPRECLAIEDSAFGITSAQGAGMFCIGINTHRNRDQVKKADVIVDYYNQIDMKKLLK